MYVRMYVCVCSRVYVSVRCGAARSRCAPPFLQSAWSQRSLLTPFPNGSDHALSLPVSSHFPGVAREGPEAAPLTSPASTFWLSPSADSQTRNSLKVSQSCGLKNDLLCSKPLRACSHLENREPRCSCRAHCVKWVAQLYQKTSLVLSHWTGQDDWTFWELVSFGGVTDSLVW